MDGIIKMNTSEYQVRARPYQIEAVERLWNYFANGGQGNPLLALPTGVGKSLIPPLFIQRAFKQFPNSRMAMFTHVKELVEQNRKALLRVWPIAPVGIYSAGLNQKDGFYPIVFGSIQTAYRNIERIGHRDILFIDECHLISPTRSTMYRDAIRKLKLINPYLKVVGLTATPFRMGQGRLTEATYSKVDDRISSPIFTDLIYDLTTVEAFNHLLDEYYLTPLIPRPTSVVIDVSDVREVNGDFVQQDLAVAYARQNITDRAIAESVAIARNRKAWIVFGAGIRNCEIITEKLNNVGISACCVHSDLTNEDRDSYLTAYKAGRFQAIVSNNILTTGFDHPAVDCIVDLRPTTSVVLHVQKYGRGTRPLFHPSYSNEMLQYKEHRKAAIELAGKINCLVLDFAGNTNRLGPINDPIIPNPKRKGTGEIPIKICPQCGAYNHTIAKFCCDTTCGYEFPFRSKLKPQASTADIIRRPGQPGSNTDVQVSILDVDSMHAYLHKKAGKPDKVRIQYFCNIQTFNTWLGFEPDEKSFVRHKSNEWWRQHAGDDCPLSTAEALDRIKECRQTKQIRVLIGGKYPEIQEFLF